MSILDEVDAFDFAEIEPSDSGGSGAGKVKFDLISFKKYTDSSNVDFFDVVGPEDGLVLSGVMVEAVQKVPLTALAGEIGPSDDDVSLVAATLHNEMWASIVDV